MLHTRNKVLEKVTRLRSHPAWEEVPLQQGDQKEVSLQEGQEGGAGAVRVKPWALLLLLSVDTYSWEAFKFYFKSSKARLLTGKLENDPPGGSGES